MNRKAAGTNVVPGCASPYLTYYEMAKEGHFWIEWRFTVFWQQLRFLGLLQNVPLKGLDVGCGNGVVRRQIEKQTCWAVDGIDLIAEALALNHPQRGQTFLYNIADRQLNLKETYDFIILFDVIEHIRNPQSFVESVVYHLKPEGWLFVNVPALPSLFSAYDFAQQHFRRYHKKMLRQEFRSDILEIRDLRYWGLSLIPFAFMRKFQPGKQTPPEVILARGFNPPGRWLNHWLLRAMRLETALLKKPLLGTSLMMAAVKICPSKSV